MVIFNTNIVDVLEGKILESYDVVIDGTKIVQISPNGKLSPSANMRVVMGKDKFLVPALWDMSAQIDDSLPSTHRYIGEGIFGVQNSKSSLGTILSLRDSISKGLIFGPIIYTAAAIPQASLGSTDSRGKALDSLISHGSNVLWTEHTNTESTFWEIVEKGKSQKIIAGGEVPDGISWSEASNRGLHQISLHTQAIPDLLKEAKSFPDLARNATFLSPNLKEWFYTLFPDSTLLSSAGYPNYMGIKAQSTPSRFSNLPLRDRLNLWAQLLRFTKQAWHLGVPLLAGSSVNSSTGSPANSLIEDLIALQQAGIPQSEVLKIAILNPAAYFDIADRFGSVSPGRHAQLLFLKSNPLLDIEAFLDIDAIMLWGNTIDAETLKALNQF